MTSRPKPQKRRGGLITVYRPFFEGKAPALTALSVSSFIGGLAEAGMLLVLARLAFQIGGSPVAKHGTGLGWLTLDVDQMFLLAFGLTVARLGFQMLAAHLTAQIGADLTAAIRERTFVDYIHASWAVQSSERQSDIQDLLIRHVNRCTIAVGVMAAGLAALFSLVALVGTAVVVDPVSAGLIIVAGLVLFPLLRPVTGIAKRAAARQIEAGREFSARALETIEMSSEIRTFGVSGEVSSRLAVATAAEVRPIYVSSLLTRAVSAVYQVAAVLILLAGLYVTYVPRSTAGVVGCDRRDPGEGVEPERDPAIGLPLDVGDDGVRRAPALRARTLSGLGPAVG
ncbi:MAG: ABC transporter transmembrane domain-containing protein [Microthrixaceae bacterium]